jgi:hypothetical protein
MEGLVIGEVCGDGLVEGFEVVVGVDEKELVVDLDVIDCELFKVDMLDCGEKIDRGLVGRKVEGVDELVNR